LVFDRILLSLPLAIAFMIFYIMRTNKKKIAVTAACISLLLAFFQAKFMSQIFYTDQMRYNDDVHLAYEFEKIINKVQPPERRLPVIFVGYYSKVVNQDFLGRYRSIAGSSFFATNEWDPQSNRPTWFMATLGINYAYTRVEKFDQASKEIILSMPYYPNPYCAREFGDYIVVKLPLMLPWPGE
jgi:hypothetical protein